MPDKDTHYLIAIAGPTAVGKTTVTLNLAEHFQCPVLSADSRQLYRELNIGTAKPGVEELKRVRHYFINHLSIRESYSAGRFEREFDTLTGKLFKKNTVLILSGGTGLFFKAALHGLDAFPNIPKAVRAHWMRIFRKEGVGTLQKKLKEVDPQYFKKVDLNNHMRIIRALSIYEATGQPYSTFLKKSEKQLAFKVIKILLERPRKELYKRIDDRVDKMMEDGLLDEVKSVAEFRDHQALQTVGYKELFAYLDGEMPLEEAIEKIKQHTRNYAKRQLTWFRNQGTHKVFYPDDLNGILRFLKKGTDSSI